MLGFSHLIRAEQELEFEIGFWCFGADFNLLVFSPVMEQPKQWMSFVCNSSTALAAGLDILH